MDTDQRSHGETHLNEKIIDWESVDSSVMLNPHWPESDLEALRYLTERFQQPGHVWIASSGSSAKDLRSVKLIALAKKAFLAAAAGANEHLQSTKDDIWLNPLPTFHVGGLSIYARAHLSQASIVSYQGPWKPESFFEALLSSKATLTSLVPTQVFDLVEKRLEAPKTLRAIVVGGGALAADLYEQALNLGWPLLPSFGMTECCSQVATAELSSLQSRDPKLKLLPHIKASATDEKYLKLQSPALLTGIARWQADEAQWMDPKDGSWFTTEDLVTIENGYLKPEGRGNHFVKVMGEGISMFRLQAIFEEIVRGEDPEAWQNYALLTIPHARRENEIVLAHATTNPAKLDRILQRYNSQVLSIEKIQRIFAVAKIPRTDLGKIKFEQIAQDLKNLA